MSEHESALAAGFEEQAILLRQNDDGTVTATQPGLDIEGRGPNAGRAVENFGAAVAMACFEEPSTESSSSEPEVPADD